MSSTEVDSDDSQSVHLLVLIHGMWGNPDHLLKMRQIMEEKRAQQDSERGPNGERLHILVAETNKDNGTYDGIDWGGERVAKEVYDEVQKLKEKGKTVTRFSVTGYSLGGLISRYVVGILHQRGFFVDVIPVNFNTIATPHIGLPRYRGFMAKLFAYFGPRLLSRTGEQFYVIDKWSENGRPLLEVMADPNRIFYKALTRFEQVCFYANAVNDTTVPYATAAIELEDVFLNHRLNGMKIELDEEYSPIIKSYTPTQPEAFQPPPKPRVLSHKWFESFKLNHPLVPPALQFGYPWDVIILISTPLLVPMVLPVVIARLALASHSSRARIRRLEKEESNRERLVHVVGRLEREMEDAVVDMFDSPGLSDAESSQPSLSASAAKADLDAAAKAQSLQKQDIVLSDVQKKIVAWLNTLPGLKKELVFIHPARNAHPVIISRDAERFPSRKRGEGVIRHWADHFII